MDKHLRVAQVARELGCSERFLREGEKRGRLPRARRDLNSWRVYTEEDIERLRELIVPNTESEILPGSGENNRKP